MQNSKVRWLVIFTFFCVTLLKGQVDDLLPPQFNFISISPDSLGNGDSLQVIIGATDDISGLNSIQVDIRNPIGGQPQSFHGNISTWVDEGNNHYSKKIKLNDFAINGSWYVSDIFIYDYASNIFHTNYLESSLPAFYVNSIHTDILPPVLHSISVSPDTLNDSDTLFINVHVTDNDSGLNSIQIDVRNPEGLQFHSLNNYVENFTIVGQDSLQSYIILGENLLGGEWYVSNVFLSDNLGNIISYNATNFDLPMFIVNQQLPIDTIKPELISIEVNPDTIYSGDSIYIRINAIDDNSGVSGIQVDAINPYGTQQHSINGYIESWVEIDNNLYEKKMGIGEWANSGIWQISNLFIHDNAGNVLHIDTMDFDLPFFYVNPITSISNLPNNSIVIYPNPAIDYVKIKYDLSKIHSVYLLDINGINLEKIYVTKNGVIDLSALKPGSYIIKIILDGGEVIFKQIIKV